MRLPVPDRFRKNHVLIFITVVFVGQILESTDPVFALLTAAFIGLWAVAYNFTGGIQYSSGSFVFANGLISVVVAVTAKVFLLQRGESHLLAPITTMACYTLGMLMTAIVMFLVSQLRSKTPILGSSYTDAELKRASIVCFVVGLVLTAVLSRGETSEGSLLSALAQINYFPIITILFGTMYAIRSSGGARSTNWIVLAGIALSVLRGILYFGKTNLLLGFLAWGVTAALAGYNFKLKQLIPLALGFVFMIYYLVPYAQYVRNYGSKSGSALENIPVAISYLSDLGGTRQLYIDAIGEVDLNDEAHFYDQREGFLDRLVQIAADDQLIDYTEKGHVFGLLPTYVSFANLVPHFIWRNKPFLNAGNTYAHEIGGILADEDTTTGISYTATADAFHQASWLGLLVLLPLTLFLVFITLDSFLGSARHSALSMQMVVLMLMDGGAGGVNFGLHYMTFGIIGLYLVVWTIKADALISKRSLVLESQTA